MTKLPLARLQSGQVVSSRLPSTTGFAGRDELLRLWDALSDDGKRVVLFAAVAAAKDEGLPEGDGPLVRTGKR